jgi:hypothetical protein
MASPALTAETASDRHCEGQVVTCAHCGRPANECDGTECAGVLETRDWMVPGYRRARDGSADQPRNVPGGPPARA